LTNGVIKPSKSKEKDEKNKDIRIFDLLACQGNFQGLDLEVSFFPKMCSRVLQVQLVAPTGMTQTEENSIVLSLPTKM